MLDNLKNITAEVTDEIKSVNDLNSLEEFRIKYLSRKGIVASLFENLKDVPKEEKGAYGKHLNELKNLVNNLFEEKKNSFGSAEEKSDIDITLEGRTYNEGTRHLISKALEEISSIFVKIGFKIYDGPEIETEFHNFDALNTPDYHPSRDMQDTFYIDEKGKPSNENGKILLRTHTSPGQIRAMLGHKPPIRIILPGKVFRNEAISARSLSQFHQIEGLYVDKDVTFGDLKGTLDYFAKQFFGDDLKTRMRPSFFPFTEPSAEVDVECFICKGEGCRICKHTGWVEIAGCGMVNPKVFENVGYEEGEYTGFAFGMGIERTIMVKYGIPDIRMFYENDVRFLKQF